MVSSKLRKLQAKIIELMPKCDKLRHSVFFTLLYLIFVHLGLHDTVAFYGVLIASTALEAGQKLTGGKNSVFEILKDIFWSNIINLLIFLECHH